MHELSLTLDNAVSKHCQKKHRKHHPSILSEDNTLCEEQIFSTSISLVDPDRLAFLGNGGIKDTSLFFHVFLFSPEEGVNDDRLNGYLL